MEGLLTNYCCKLNTFNLGKIKLINLRRGGGVESVPSALSAKTPPRAKSYEAKKKYEIQTES